MKIRNFIDFELEVELMYDYNFRSTDVEFPYDFDLEKVFLASLANDPDMLDQLNKICGTKFDLNTDIEELKLQNIYNLFNGGFSLDDSPLGSRITICDHVIYLELDSNTLEIKNFDWDWIMGTNKYYSGVSKPRVCIDTFRTL